MQKISPPILPKRPRAMHKGDAGRVVVLGGARGMLGATLLAGEAALRCGGGLVTIATQDTHVDLPALRCPELMSVDALQLTPAELTAADSASPARADAVVLGPGLGMGIWGERVFARFIHCEIPMVVDADGLNWLARGVASISGASASGAPPRAWILTPHAGEAARLLQCTRDEIQAQRAESARAIATRFGGICILKGADTLIAAADGEILRCDRGNPGMATAGMGDVLAGMLAGLWGQGMSASATAAAAVWLHATAADRGAARLGERSLLARDVLQNIPPVLSACVADSGGGEY